MPDGCRSHAIAPQRVEAWWSKAEDVKTEFAVCECCVGPFPARFVTDPANGQKVGIGGKCRFCARR